MRHFNRSPPEKNRRESSLCCSNSVPAINSKLYRKPDFQKKSFQTWKNNSGRLINIWKKPKSFAPPPPMTKKLQKLFLFFMAFDFFCVEMRCRSQSVEKENVAMFEKEIWLVIQHHYWVMHRLTMFTHLRKIYFLT